MNERMRKLAEEAGITTNFDTDYFEKDVNKWVDYYSKKFAELLIQECAGIITSQDVDPAFKNRMAWAIKQHFGVE